VCSLKVPSFLSLEAPNLLVAFVFPTAFCFILGRSLEIAWFFENAAREFGFVV